MARPSLYLLWPASSVRVSPQAPFPAVPARRDLRSSGRVLLWCEGGVRGSVTTKTSPVAQATAKTMRDLRTSAVTQPASSAVEGARGSTATCRMAVSKERSRVWTISGKAEKASSLSASSNSGWSTNEALMSFCDASSESKTMTASSVLDPFRLSAEGLAAGGFSRLPPLQRRVRPFSWP
ncbi:hypothetical protein VTK73DRAFT_5671 [Phialemonium thermophilum]|uniref:Uncharacterized protein n=1 Tax=Phialemonium thermophilum TaxID=223376 RepID=A0ABR3WM76_9PEZI